MFPQLSKVDHAVEPSCKLKEPAEGASENFVKGQSSESENRVYTFFSSRLYIISCQGDWFLSQSLCSTDNYLEESIHNTLESSDRVARRASYWSSKGHGNPAVPETLICKLVSDMCAISEINIQPFHDIDTSSFSQ
ncbi:hypothetical protein Patl1_13151 [Pistacia atlantica]|uniref:Uncharacterized protein n=1 Tax=Pistacia atlantica TaxID=434234 RepID=A0ACC1AT67_9ROSI|nr:hypothetical protein Patl1_13151 [Pistacia atlantica]